LSLEEGGGAVYTHRKVVVSQAGFVRSGVVVGGHVPVASQQIVDVVALPSSVLPDTRTEAKFGIRDERSPFVVLEVIPERVSKHQSTNGVTVTIRTMRIEFTTRIALGDVNLRKVSLTSDLNVIRRLDEMHALQRPIRDRPRSPTRFSAPRDFLPFGIADRTNTRRSPETEIINVVDPRRLTIRTLTRGSTAVICARLAVLGFVRKSRDRVAHVPDLVRVASSTVPNLDLVPVGRRAVGEVGAFTMIGPCEMIIGGVVPLLVLIAAGASPDLEFCAVGVYAASYVETL